MARYFFYFVFILGFFQTPVFSEACETMSDSEFRIRDFFIKDFSRNLFFLQMEADSPDLLTKKLAFDVSPELRTEKTIDSSEKELEIKSSKFQLFVGKIKATNMKGSYTPYFKGKSRKMEWEVIPEKTIEAGTHCVTLRDQDDKVLDQFSYTIKETRHEPGQQPLILQFQPRGGPIGDTITVKALNLGKDISQIYFYVLKPQDKQGSYAFKDKEACVLFPYYLSPEITEGKLTYQEVKFTLAHYLMKDCSLDEDFTFYEKIFGKELKVKLYVNARPSTIESTMVLYENWRRYAITMGLLITFLFLGILTLMSQKINFFPDIFIDPDTNSYSLANLQAFCWTIVLMGSYFYIAICQGMILHNMELPDFNFSLIALLGVSYGGMITHNYIDKRKKGNLLSCYS